MATEAGARHFITGSRWDFPQFDDQTPVVSEGEEDPPPTAPRPIRLGVAGFLGIVAIAVVISAVGVVMKSRGSTEEVLPEHSTAQEATEAAPSTKALVVHVTGAVKKEGLVTLIEGDRVADAIDGAGGASGDANLAAVNLARFVIDGEHLVVPRAGEQIADAEVGGHSGALSLSLASETELQELPGVGPAIAARIVSWREKNGPFRQVEDVLAVQGIGPSTLQGFRDLVIP